METQEVRTGGFRWRILPALAGVKHLLGPAGFRLDLVESAVVKHVPHRDVSRVVVGGLDLHVKHYKGDARDWARCLFRGRRAVREFAICREVARRGVPTVEALGVGEYANRLGASDSVLVTRTLPDARPLLDYLEHELPALPLALRAVTRQRLALALGELLARQHRAGVRHTDLHPGNILVRFDEGEPRLLLIDLDAVRLGPPMGWRASRENLVVLDRWFALRFGRADRRRAWRAYRAARPDLAIDERAAAREIAEATAASLITQMSQFDRRCRGGNRHYVRVSGGLAIAGFDRAALARLLGDPDSLFDGPGANLLKHSSSSAVVEGEVALSGQARAVVCKRFGWSWKSALASLFRPPPALRSYVLGHGFRLRGLPTPRPLAVWHRRRFGLVRESYLLTEKVPDAIHLRGFVERAGPGDRVRAVIDELARLLRSLHDAGLSHRDLKAANILVSPADHAMSVRGLRDLPPSPGRDRVWFIDLVGARRYGKLGRLRRVRDLARLHMSFLDHPLVSRADRLRFLRTYLAWGLRGKAGWKGWWRQVHAAAVEKAGRTAGRGRVVG
jgi:tRNA A-37 threonylcarbamoyl transferase component Bud32